MDLNAASLNGVGGLFDITATEAEAIATANIQFTFNSFVYPPEDGWLIVSVPTPWTLNPGGEDGLGISESLTIGNFFTQTCDAYASSMDCIQTVPTMGPWVSYYEPQTVVIPVTISNPYTFDFTATVTANDGEWDYPFGTFDATVSYTFIPAPEPSAWLLLLGAMPVGALTLCVRRNKERR